MTMSEKQPLLVVYQNGQALPEGMDPEMQYYATTAAAQDHYLLAAARRHRRRTAVRRLLHVAALTLAVAGVVYWVRSGHHIGLPAFLSSLLFGKSSTVGATPLDGPLVLPDRPQYQRYNHGATVDYPLASYDVSFDSEHALAIAQNTTRSRSPAAGGDDDDVHWRRVHVSGEVVVRRAVAGVAPSVSVEAVSNDERIKTNTAFDHGKQGQQRLVVLVDDRIWIDETGAATGMPCVVVRVTVWVPAGGAHLRALEIGAAHLGVQLIDNLDLVVDEHARLASVVGSVDASQPLPKSVAAEAAAGADEAVVALKAHYRFEAPIVDVATTTGAIRGPWSLYNSLRLFSVAGPIDVSVAPVAAAASAAATAHGVLAPLAALSIQSVTGPIRFEEVRGGSARPHTLSVVSHSGAINGTATFAKSAQIDTVSGNVDVALQPVLLTHPGVVDPEERGASLTSNSVSGNTRLQLLDADADVLDFLSSSHKAVSGSVDVHYPASWVGAIRLKAVAPGTALAVEGKDVHVIPDAPGSWPHPFGRFVKAVKGGDDANDGFVAGRRSTVFAEAVTGGVRLAFPL